MKKKIIILGSDTKKGSIAFSFFRKYNNLYDITGLSSVNSSGSNINKTFLKQIREINPKYIYVDSLEAKKEIEKEFINSQIITKENSVSKFIKITPADIVVSALQGIDSVKPILSAIHDLKDIAIIKKDPLFYLGSILKKEADTKGVRLYYLSNYFSAVEKLLINKSAKDINKIIVFTDYRKGRSENYFNEGDK
ncbi:MAG: hypothetical protein V1824_00540, partial [archaeon]